MNVVSLGFWHVHSNEYATEAQQTPDVDLVAVWDTDTARAHEAAERYAVPFIPDLDTILEDSHIDGVIVCVPTVQHRDIVLRCINAGKHIFLEKVISSSMEESRAIVDAARRSGVALTVSLRRSDRGYAGQIADLATSGAVGQVTALRVRDSHPFAWPTTDRPEGVLPDRFYNRDETGGGVLIDLCHPLYLLARIAGRPQSVASAFGYVTHRDVEDNVAAILLYPDGAIGVAEVASVARIAPFTIDVHGTEGSIMYSEPGIGELAYQAGLPDGGKSSDTGPSLRRWSRRDADPRWIDEVIRDDEPRAFEQWVANVRTGRRDEENLDLALHLSAIVEAAYISAAERRDVDVEPL